MDYSYLAFDNKIIDMYQHEVDTILKFKKIENKDLIFILKNANCKESVASIIIFLEEVLTVKQDLNVSDLYSVWLILNKIKYLQILNYEWVILLKNTEKIYQRDISIFLLDHFDGFLATMINDVIQLNMDVLNNCYGLKSFNKTYLKIKKYSSIGYLKPSFNTKWKYLIKILSTQFKYYNFAENKFNTFELGKTKLFERDWNPKDLDFFYLNTNTLKIKVDAILDIQNIAKRIALEIKPIEEDIQLIEGEVSTKHKKEKQIIEGNEEINDKNSTINSTQTIPSESWQIDELADLDEFVPQSS